MATTLAYDQVLWMLLESAHKEYGGRWVQVGDAIRALVVPLRIGASNRWVFVCQKLPMSARLLFFPLVPHMERGEDNRLVTEIAQEIAECGAARVLLYRILLVVAEDGRIRVPHDKLGLAGHFPPSLQADLDARIVREVMQSAATALTGDESSVAYDESAAVVLMDAVRYAVSYPDRAEVEWRARSTEK